MTRESRSARKAREALARNRVAIDAASPSGTPSGRPSSFRRRKRRPEKR